ncbi:MAG: hypothetical protein AB7U18_16040, partial [Dehalococcoidia bacterium]
MLPDAACQAPRKDGAPCKAVIVLTSGYCALHDPDRQAEVQAARVRGGHGKAKTARAARLVPSMLRPVLATVLDALGEVHRGELEPKQAQAMAALAGAAVRLYTAGVVEQR